MKCRFCNRDAGFLSRKHRECQDKHDDGWSKMLSLSADAALGDRPSDGLVAELGRIAQASYASDFDVRGAVVMGWIAAAARAVDDHLVTKEEEEALDAFMTKYNIDGAEIMAVDGGMEVLERVSHMTVLQGIEAGNIPDPARWDQHDLPFRFMKSETLVWAFPDVSYLEDRVRRERVGGSRGAAVRVAKGVYVGGSQFRSRSVETEITEHVDYGILALTTKHLYFSGERRNFRIRYDRIVALEAYPDGLGVTRDAQNARRQRFVVGDGWFVCNLASLLSDRAEG